MGTKDPVASDTKLTRLQTLIRMGSEQHNKTTKKCLPDFDILYMKTQETPVCEKDADS